MMMNELLRETLANFVEVHDLVRDHGGKYARQHILPYLPVAAASGLLFATTNGKSVVGMMIAGPTNKPEGRDNFTEEGTVLWCYEWLVHPDYREPIGVLKRVTEELKNMAKARYPHTETFCYQHTDRFIEHKIKRGEECALEEAEPVTSAREEIEPSSSSRSPTKDRSADSRSLPSSTSS